MNIKYYSVVCITLLCLIFSEACKKGCTNPTAYNYARSAKVEDGSCLYCDSALTMSNTTSTGIADLNNSSQFFEQTVVLLSVTSNFKTYSGNGCRLLGYPNTNGSVCAPTYYTGVLQNETNRKITFSGLIEIQTIQDSTIFNDYNIANIIIPPNGSTTFNIGNGGCLQKFATINVQILSSGFSYQ